MKWNPTASRMSLLLAGMLGLSVPEAPAAPLLCGAYQLDITPKTLPVIRNGGFLEAQEDQVQDPLHARALVLKRGETTVALVVVDSCMVPRTLCDDAKAILETEVGLRPDHVMISATHTHSAPSVMNYCLGSRADPAYTATLPGLIAEAVAGAHQRLQPAQAAWAPVDAGEYTHVRRWIARTDLLDVDPFGERTVQANMHPGHQKPGTIGPSGPKDPWLTLLSLQTAEGKPIAVLANFSMHYFGAGRGISADYFGRFASGLAQRLAPGDPSFVGILSQGTSGDIWRADYGRPKVDWTMEDYTNRLLDLAEAACRRMEHAGELPLAMRVERLTLDRRLPDANRLAWAEALLGNMEGRPL